MGALRNDGLADETVGRNITLTLTLSLTLTTAVESSSNGSTAGYDRV
jgi:hypothetical protein